MDSLAEMSVEETLKHLKAIDTFRFMMDSDTKVIVKSKGRAVRFMGIATSGLIMVRFNSAEYRYPIEDIHIEPKTFARYLVEKMSQGKTHEEDVIIKNAGMPIPVARQFIGSFDQTFI